MKKYIILFICVPLLLISSCKNTEKSETAEQNGKDETENSGSEIFGSVSEIIGNLAEIDLAVMPDTGMPVPMDRPAFNPDRFDPENLPEGVVINEDGSVSINRGEMPEGGGPMIFNGEIPENFDPENMPEGFSARRIEGGRVEGGQRILNENGGDIPEMRNGVPNIGAILEYTGEKTEFIIPVGIPIYALTDGGTETEIELSDIKAGNLIRVTFGEDGKTVDKILISQITALSPSQTEEMQKRINERSKAVSGGEGENESESESESEG